MLCLFHVLLMFFILAGWLAGWLDGWLAGWLAVWMAGWLAWLAGGWPASERCPATRRGRCEPPCAPCVPMRARPVPHWLPCALARARARGTPPDTCPIARARAGHLPRLFPWRRPCALARTRADIPETPPYRGFAPPLRGALVFGRGKAAPKIKKAPPLLYRECG